MPSCGEVERQLRERAGVADELDLSRGDRAHALVVPHGVAGGVGHPAPAQDVLDRDVRRAPSLRAASVGAAAACPSVISRRGRRAAGRADAERRRRREGLDGAADLQEDVPSGQVPGEDRRGPGGQVGLARELQVERLEPPRGLQQQRGSIAAEARGEGDVAAQQVDPGALELVERSGLRRGQEPERRVERAGLEARLRRGQRALRAPRRVGGQRDGALQERGRGGESAASLRPAGRALELGGDLLVGSRRRSGAVPGAPVRVRLGVGGVGEGAMDAVAILGGSRAVGGGSDEWMRELDAPTDREQPGVHRRVGRSHVDAEGLGGTVEQHGVAEWLCGRGEDEQLRVGGELAEAPDVALFDLADDRVAVGQPEPAGEICGVPGARELEQRERVAVALGDDLVADRRIQRAVHVLQQQRARVAVAESVDGQLGEPGEDVVADARARAQTSATRSARRRRATKPRICAEAWSSHCASSTMQTSGCSSATSANSVSVASPTRNRSGAGPVAQAEHRRERVPLRGGQPVEVIQHRRAELMQAAVGQLHLRLDADGPCATRPPSARSDR